MAGKVNLRLLIICFLSFSINSFSQKSHERKLDKEMLLVYATINDSVQLFRPDTNWLNKSVCIKLKADTISTDSISRVNPKSNNFFYQGNIYNYNQLYSLSSGNPINHFIINFFTVEPAGRFLPENIKTNANCLSEEQIQYYKDCWGTKDQPRQPGEIFKIWLTEIMVSDYVMNKTFFLNDIAFIITNKR